MSEETEDGPPVPYGAWLVNSKTNRVAGPFTTRRIERGRTEPMGLIDQTPEQRAAIHEFNRAMEQWRGEFVAKMNTFGAAIAAPLVAGLRTAQSHIEGGSTA